MLIPENTHKEIPVSKKRSALIAGLLSYFCIGLGHVYCGNLKRGIILFILYNVIFISFLFLQFILPPVFNFFSFVLVSISFYIFVIADSVRIATKESGSYLLKSYNKWYYYLLIYFSVSILYSSLILAPLIKSNIVEAYKIPTGSMEKTLLVGDFILVDKSAYGINLPFVNKKILHIENVKRGDLSVYIYPGDRDETDPNEEANYIKRCVGIPGDTIQIIDKKLYVNGEIFPNPPNTMFDKLKRPENFVNPRMFPKGSEWNEDWYGPIRVPRKGDRLKIDSSNFEGWKIFIMREGHSVKLSLDNKVLVDYKELLNGEYIVEKDYLFMMGDNRNNSLDSRFIGFIPEENVTGKVSMIYWSWDPSISFLNLTELIGSIRWERIGSMIR